MPHKFFNAKYGQPLRALLTGGNYLSEIVHFGDKQIFEGATTYTNLLFLDKSGSEEFRFVKVEDLSAWRNAIKADGTIIPSNNATEHEWNFATGLSLELLDKLSRNPTKLLNAASRIAQGIRTSANEIYVMELISKSSDGKIVNVKSKLLDKNFEIERNVISLFLQGREIKPYSILPSSKVVIIPYDAENGRMKFIVREEMQNRYPKTYQYLLENKIELEEREHGKMKGDSWYAYVYPKNLEVMKACKILVPDIANRGSFALDELGEYSFTSGYGIILKSDLKESVKFVLGLLNSKVLDFYLKRISTTMRGGFFRYFAQYLEQLPIRTIDFSDPADVARHDRMVSLVEKMLDLHKQLPKAGTPHEKTALERQIEATDGQIDALVYELYGLTEEEIGIVEAAGR